MRFNFQKLEECKKAKQFHSISLNLIEDKDFSRTSKNQLERASFSIILNIAEGSGRFSKADRKNFFVISRSSIFECIAILNVQKDHKIINQNDYNKLEALRDELSRILFAMIRNLEKKSII